MGDIFYFSDITSVCGFTQVLIALLANIESREWRRRQAAAGIVEYENPRASTTDDVECFFSTLRDLVGKNFTVRKVQDTWRKLCIEFTKRVDPGLPFYYYTAAHDRFAEGPLSNFDVKKQSKRNPRHMRVRRAELLQTDTRRVTLPQPGSKSTRMQFHNIPISIPPPPRSTTQNTHMLMLINLQCVLLYKK